MKKKSKTKHQKSKNAKNKNDTTEKTTKNVLNQYLSRFQLSQIGMVIFIPRNNFGGGYCISHNDFLNTLPVPSNTNHPFIFNQYNLDLDIHFFAMHHGDKFKVICQYVGYIHLKWRFFTILINQKRLLLNIKYFSSFTYFFSVLLATHKLKKLRNRENFFTYVIVCWFSNFFKFNYGYIIMGMFLMVFSFIVNFSHFVRLHPFNLDIFYNKNFTKKEEFFSILQSWRFVIHGFCWKV